ncbi:hypothetical protein B5J99_14480 [Blastomonas fulva]|uniref:PIN domain-containing protein n=2 Tax=Blastomonas fulva TaxID=1550728 RepID=A0ABN5BCH6_9SPHN|nr:hypothetical protein B5J99_14480 [Blastomonas fulva]
MIDAHLLDDIADDRLDQREARDKMVSIPITEMQIMLPHSVKAEIEHPKTPAIVKERASAFIYSFDTKIATASTLRKVKEIMRGNAAGTKHDRDAEHCCDAAIWGSFFVTLDARIIRKREEIAVLFSGLWIMTPVEWIANLEHHRCVAPDGDDDLLSLTG